MSTPQREIAEIQRFLNSKRFRGITRPYTAEMVYKLRGSLKIEYTLAKTGTEKLWDLCHAPDIVRALGAENGHQAVQMVRANLKAIYCSGWQVAGNANTAGETYPDQSLYPADSVPALVRRINKALQRQDQIQHFENTENLDWFVPIVADAEAGFGGVLNCFELMKHMVEAGAAGVHFEDQLASEKKCGHLGGKVVIPTSQFIDKLVAARLAADVLEIPTLLIARTDADSAKLLANGVDPRDHAFIDGSPDRKGFFKFKGGISAAIDRALAYAPYADMLWCETSNPNIDDAERFAKAVHSKFPGKLLAYNCSPSFNWKRFLTDAEIADFQKKLNAMGYKFQFVTLAGFHANNSKMFDLAMDYNTRGMSAYVDLQQEELFSEHLGYTAVRHQREVGTGYFDAIQMAITNDDTDLIALKGSTEKEQF